MFGLASRPMIRISLVGLLCGVSLWAGPLQVRIDHSFGGAPLKAGALCLTNSAGQELSITRASYLLSGFALQNRAGDWIEFTNTFAWIDVAKERNSFEVQGVPAGNYQRLRFNVGLSSALNHTNPGSFSPASPLNPNINGLHWSWQGGYVFLALEGLWKTGQGELSGYSYHLATDSLLMRVEIPVEVAGEGLLTLGFDLMRLFARQITEDTSSTHSRPGDELARSLAAAIETAFVARSFVGRSSRPEEKTQSALVARTAKPYRFKIPNYAPKPSLPLDNPLTEEGVALGWRLYNDKSLSINGRQACASCHQADAGFVDRGKRVSIGAEGTPGVRNAMSLSNLAWKQSFFWDGRAQTLREQVLMPIENPMEMHESITNVVFKLRSDSEYQQMFADAFGEPEINPGRVARAIEQFLLVQTSFNSKFDHALRGEVELSDQEKRGFELFQTEYDPRRGQLGGDCFHCHGGPLFQSQDFANNGLDSTFSDRGRADVTGKDTDAGKFAVPSLRNVALTAPYMHDGRFKTLEEVIDHYNSGVKRSETLDPNLAKHPHGGVPLTAADKQALVAFLRTLTDSTLLEASRRASEDNFALHDSLAAQ